MACPNFMAVALGVPKTSVAAAAHTEADNRVVCPAAAVKKPM